MTSRRSRLSPTFARYAEEARQRAASLVLLLIAEPVDLSAVTLQAHTLAGGGATMGAEAVTLAARALEHLAEDLVAMARQPTPEERVRMAGWADELVRLVAAFDIDAMLDDFIARVFPQG